MKIFLDDVRTVDMIYFETEGFHVIRNVEDFKDFINENGLPEYISFDHDLGVDDSGNLLPTGYDAVKWMVFEKEFDISDVDFYVHSDNPVGANNISCLLNNWKKELKRRKALI